MKKHLIAVAVASAVATPAIAQVTMSGNMDIGVGRTTINQINRTSTVSGMFVTPDIRFSGTEDLGGGLKATFRITQEFNVSNGILTDSSVGSTTGNNTGTTGVAGVNNATASSFGESRFQETSLALSGGFGEVKLGSFNHTARDNAGVGRFAGEFARLSGNFRGIGSKASNSIQYTTPTVSGLSASLGTANGGRSKADHGYASVMTGSIGFAQGAMAIRASHLQSDNATSTGRNIEQVFGGSYDLGMARVGYVYAKETSEGTKATTNAHVINAAIPMGSGLTAHGSYHSYGGAAATSNAQVIGVALVKALSKRTSLYGAYQQNKNEATAGVNQGILVGTNGQTNSAMAVGLTHAF